MKVKIKMNVPKPPTGISGITFFGACYKWKDVFYRMGDEYTVNKADFNPAIMVDLSPRKKAVPKVEKEAEAEVELNLSDEVPTESQEKRKQKKGDQTPSAMPQKIDEHTFVVKHEESGVERRKKK